MRYRQKRKYVTIFILIVTVTYFIFKDDSQAISAVKDIALRPREGHYVRNIDYNGKKYSYTVIPHYFEDQLTHVPDIYLTTLVTHATLNKIWQYLSNLMKNWHGPTELIVLLTARHDVSTMAQMWAYYKSCDRKVTKHVAVSFVFPSLMHEFWNETATQDLEPVHDCQEAAKELNHFFESKQQVDFDLKAPYASNVLKNAGQALTRTPYFLFIYVDMLPGKETHSVIERIMSRTDPTRKNMFVVPALEIKDQNYFFNEDLNAELAVELMQKDYIRVFYEKMGPMAHAPTKSRLWMQRSKYLPSNATYYKIDYKTSYEPFFVSPTKLAPFGDERFCNAGADRIIDVCRLYIGGWKFYVLTHVFTVHDGYRTSETFHKSHMIESFISDFTLAQIRHNEPSIENCFHVF